MKTRLLFILLLYAYAIGIAQNNINYKALVKDSNENVISNQNIDIQFTILEGATTVYEEIHTITTDQNGIVVTNIGDGSILSGTFSSIDWSSDVHFLNIKIDSGDGLTDLGTTQFMHVPYALLAEEAKSAKNVTGLVKIQESNSSGYRLKGSNPNNFGTIGINAIDLSISTSNSSTNGATGSYALAAGFETTASGNYATALNRNSQASGLYALAMGVSSIASGGNSIALGAVSEANSLSATAIGNSSTASGNYSLTLGRASNANGENAIAGGYISSAIGDDSVAIGRSAQSSGEGSVALGEESTAIGKNAIAIGHFAFAGQQNSIALGPSNISNGLSSVALGNNNEATGGSSTAMGISTTASAFGSTAMGNSTTASNEMATAMGSATTASGLYSTAMGFGTTASGNESTAMGFQTQASARLAVAMGYQSIASGEYAFATGRNTLASARSSVALGNRTIARSFAETVVGTYNTTYTPNSTTSWNSFDRAFVVGIGSNANFRRNAMTILKSGRVGIGTDDPQDLFHINGGRIRIGTETIDDIGLDQLAFNASLLPDIDNLLSLGNASLRWNGVWATDGTINTSDRREKKNIKALDYGLSEVLQMQPVSFNWKDHNNPDVKIGLIAQDLLKLVPEAVKTHTWKTTSEENSTLKKVELDRLGVYYSDLIPVLINAIKEQNKEIENLKKALKTQKSLEERISSLEQKISN